MRAIIAILAAILFPVFARENARCASCQSNLKQIALGVTQYIQDYDEKFPRASVTVGASTADVLAQRWAGAIQPYLKSTQILQCPSDSDAPDSNPGNTGYSDYWLTRR